MTRTVRDLMTPYPTTVPAGTSLADAARMMRDQDIGALIVATDSGPAILTDRDMVVRAVADGENTSVTSVESICSRDVVSVSPDDDADQAVAMMRDRAIRRLLVLEGGDAVGMLSVGDLAIDRDRGSALADISSAPPNR
ncbi:MAG: CBS domain-containing protein [Candidatus Dormibacteraeota bacterium]|uniref:CBS domain-containing protein n=1 Tax=Candidatus Amunia macphersoniae TaxID=3127014 RepID=A0A934KSX0_9BACT|nr:CBS domain-containing protein [Candidatus Dormibacteraeota bacterium]